MSETSKQNRSKITLFTCYGIDKWGSARNFVKFRLEIKHDWVVNYMNYVSPSLELIQTLKYYNQPNTSTS